MAVVCSQQVGECSGLEHHSFAYILASIVNAIGCAIGTFVMYAFEAVYSHIVATI